MYIWQQKKWPDFIWQSEVLQPKIDTVRQLQKKLVGKSEGLADEMDQEVRMDTLIQNAIRTSQIEGEDLNVESVRSSVARRLGLDRAGMVDSSTPQTNALIGLLMDATRNYDKPLTQQRLCDWQAALFPEGPDLFSNINIGILRSSDPMQVVSGRIDRPTIHFEAPPRSELEQELSQFINWFNHPLSGEDALLRAGIAHLWLITLHPFDDGNGRVTRAVTDMALAQAEGESIRFYSLSVAIMARRKDYYTQLEMTQKGDLDITAWLEWFLQVLEESIQQAFARIDRVMIKSNFWKQHAQTVLSRRQIKVLNRLLDNAGEEFKEGISAANYKGIAGVSKPTATRDLADLLEKGCLRKLAGGGRSTRYVIT